MYKNNQVRMTIITLLCFFKSGYIKANNVPKHTFSLLEKQAQRFFSYLPQLLLVFPIKFIPRCSVKDQIMQCNMW